jgi:C-terminal processing protease CtpA/Prc
MKHFFRYTAFAAIIGLLTFTACQKDDDDNPGTKPAEADEINMFIYSNMHDLYLWNKNVPAITNSYYNTNEDSLNAFLNRYPDHEKLFYDLLDNNLDGFSWIVDDYEELEASFEGVTKSMGYNYWFVRYGTDNVLGYVRYVVKGSPADKAGVKRGDLFNKYNGQQLTTSNVNAFMSAESYTLSFATISNNTVVPIEKTASLTAIEITEDPVFLDTVYTVNNQKIGYLVYNSFISNYDTELNNVFLKFKNEGISKLIVDLRYNTGGSVQSAIYLASMIYGPQTGKTFLKQQFNELVQKEIETEVGTDYFNMNFAADIKDDNGKSVAAINSLNMTNVYIITGRHTASASESIINGLDPYMNVVTVGDSTYGKYVGSITIYDYIDNNQTKNPNHKWAMQPIVFKISNSLGVSDYVKGLAPKVRQEEDITNMSQLGDLNEPLLSTVVSMISGTSAKSARISSGSRFKEIPLENSLKTDMYIRNFKLIK